MAQSLTPKSYYEYSSMDDRSSEESAASLLSRDELTEQSDASAAGERTSFLRKHFLSALCFLLHLGLVLIHVAVFVTHHWEHRFTFLIEHQTAVSFWTSVVTQFVGTIYCAVLVFLTQKLAMWHNFGSNKTLTAVHDCMSAWAGLGSALATLFNQAAVPASVFGTLNIVGYLACISVLHVSIPAIVSVEAFNTTVAMAAVTSGFPEYANSTAMNLTQTYMVNFPANFLRWRGILDDSQMLGLSNGSLYEVLTTATSGPGHAQVLAQGLNISCGYVSANVTNLVDSGQNPANTDFMFSMIDSRSSFQSYGLLPQPSLLPNQISIMWGNTDDNWIYMYTTALVVDSQGLQGSPIIFAQQSPTVLNLTGTNLKSSQIQFLQCFKSMVTQSGIIDTQSNTIIPGSLYPNIGKNYSTWILATEMLAPPQSSTLLGSDLWPEMLFGVPSVDGQSDVNEYLMSYLGLNPFTNGSSVISLHDIENALSNLLGMIFWTAGHIKVNPWYTQYSHGSTGLQAEGVAPVLVSGHAAVLQQETTHVRLTSNLTAATIGLTASVIQTILSMIFIFGSIQQPGAPQHVGLLRSIWIWRSHPQFSLPLRHIHRPTQTNLRRAGLVPLWQSTVKYEHMHKGWEYSEKHEDERMSVDQSKLCLLEAISARFSRTKHASMCILFHIFLVVAYGSTVLFTLRREEHNIIFSIDKQQNVSFLCKIATTAFGTVREDTTFPWLTHDFQIYYAALVYLTQRLAVSYSLQEYSLLTATQAKVSAWTGIGSALSMLYDQIKWPTSSLQVLFILLYLGTISILHVTTPALLAVQLFNSTIPIKVKTQGIPQWSSGSQNSTMAYLESTGPFLPWIDDLDQSKQPGLYKGSLYDVLEQAYPGSGPIQISAVGFNITCGYIPNVTVTDNSQSTRDKMFGLKYYNISFNAYDFYWPYLTETGPDVVLIANTLLPNSESLILFTHNPVHDSYGNSGPPVNFSLSNAPMQLLQCSNSLVVQLGEVDPGSKLVIPNSLNPSIHKDTSLWKPYEMVSSAGIAEESSLVEGEYWTQILSNLPSAVNFELVTSTGRIDSYYPDFGSMNLMQQLGLNPRASSDLNATQSATRQVLYLHDVENALSDLVASIFWIGGHVNQSELTMQTLEVSYEGPVSPPTLTTGTAVVEQVILAARLDMSFAAVLLSLGASIVLLILALGFSIGHRSSNPYPTSMGFLQTIWVFEHHPELSEILEQVEDPTDDNLREAGMVTVRLLDAVSAEDHDQGQFST